MSLIGKEEMLINTKDSRILKSIDKKKMPK